MKEYKRKLSGKVLEFDVTPILIQPDLIIVKYVVPKEYHEPVSQLTVPAGTISYGFFWVGRPFNVYYFVDKGTSLAAYVNLCTSTTKLTEETVDWTDLEIDLVVYPDGSSFVLDEDDVPDDLSEEFRADLERGKRMILADKGQAVLAEMNSWLQELAELAQ